MRGGDAIDGLVDERDGAAVVRVGLGGGGGGGPVAEEGGEAWDEEGLAAEGGEDGVLVERCGFHGGKRNLIDG